MYTLTCTKCGKTIQIAYGTGDEYYDLEGDIVGWPIPDERANNSPYCWACAREESDEIREANPDDEYDEDDEDDESE